MNVNDHVKVAQRFARAHQSYEEHAVIQKYICKKLIEYSQQFDVPHQQSRIFEIGCGTGNLTRLMWQHYAFDQYILNDLYDAVKTNFLENTSAQIEWKIGNIEQLEFPQQVNSIVSSSALQWVKHLNQVYEKAHQALLPQGYFIFSTFGAQNLQEIKKLTGQGLQYLTLQELEQQLIKAGFEVLLITEDILKLEFEHPREVLAHLKATGVTATSNNFRWTKSSLIDFYQNYQQFQLENQQYSLTYHPIYCIARSI